MLTISFILPNSTSFSMNVSVDTINSSIIILRNAYEFFRCILSLPSEPLGQKNGDVVLVVCVGLFIRTFLSLKTYSLKNCWGGEGAY